MLDFERRSKPLRELQLVPLIDIVFILIIFFMLTTNFMKLESMELLLPSAGASAKTVTAADMSHIYLHADGKISYGQRPVDKLDLKRTLSSIFTTSPEQRVVVLVAEQVSLQTLVEVMDIVYLAGGKNVFVREWDQKDNSQSAAPAKGGANGV